MPEMALFCAPKGTGDQGQTKVEWGDEVWAARLKLPLMLRHKVRCRCHRAIILLCLWNLRNLPDVCESEFSRSCDSQPRALADG